MPNDIPAQGSDAAAAVSVVTAAEEGLAEARLRQLEKRYDALVRATGQINWTANVEGLVVEDQPTWRAFTGQSVEQTMGAAWEDAINPEDLPALNAAWQEAARRKSVYEVAYRTRRHDGEYRTLLERGVPVLNADGTIREWVGCCTDITELQTARAEAEQRARQLEAILAAIPERLAIFDAEGTLIHMNPASIAAAGAERGYERKEQLAQSYGLRKLDGSALTIEELPLSQALHGEHVSNVELLISGATGQDEQMLVSAAPFYDEAGRLDGVVTVASDISALHQAQREAATRAAQLEATFQAMVNGVVIYDAQGRIAGMNSAARALFGSAAEPDFIERPIDVRTRQIDVFDGQGQPLAPENWPGARILRGEVLVGAEAMDVMFHTRDGGEVWTTVTGAPIHDGDGHIAGGIVLYHDVTERQHTQRRTHETLAALLAMAEALVQDPDAPIATGNAPSNRWPRFATAHRLAELTASVLGCTRVSISTIDPETQIVRAVAVVGLTAEQEPQWWLEQERQTARFGEGGDPEQAARFAAGELFVLDYTQPPLNAAPNPYNITTAVAAPMRTGDQLVGILALDYGGEPHVFQPDELALAEAVSKLAAAVIERERLLRQRAEDEARVLALSEANRRMDEFLGIASHELRTPVTVIKANVQLLGRRIQANSEHANGASPREIHLLQSTERQVERLVRLVNDLVDVSRVRAGKLEMRQEPCDLVAVVRDAVEGQRLASPERAITLKLPDEPIVLVADADRIGQVVTNYVTNALKYSPATKPVAVELRCDKDNAWLGVRDQGQGIPLKEQPRVWDLFHQAPGITVQSGSAVGLGLGLHICQTIITRHGGAVGVESKPGKGSTFWFTLPLDAKAETD